MKIQHRRDERGATAVLFAILALVLLGVSALAVDVGHIFAKRAALQSNVDLAVLAATAKLTTAGPCNAEVVSTATSYLTLDSNRTPNQQAVNLGGSAGDIDGFIQCNNWRVELWAPTSRVDYGMAKAVTSEEGVDVPAFAAAQIKSPNLATLPMYVSSTCASGTHITITDPPNGATKSLASPNFLETGSLASLQFNGTKVSPNRFLDDDIAAGATNVKVQIKNPGFAAGDIIAFTSHDDLTVTRRHTVSSSDVGSNATTFPLPTEVTDNPGIWWVRVQRGGDYMVKDEAEPITVGDLGLCNGSLSGNFGTLRLARTDPSHELVKNLILGAEPTLTINPSSAVPCPVAQSETTPTDGTDCLSTKPGFPGSELTDGLIHGVAGLDGRLDADTRAGCSRNNSASRTPTTYPLNDDTLKCFLVNSATLSNVLAGGNTPNSLSGEIVTSPRFFRIPKLPDDPNHGSSTNYPVTGFYYVFVTTEGKSAVTGYNGLTMRPNGVKVQTLSVAILDDKSLPDTVPNDGDTVDYTGSGPKVVVLVN